jgi:hypothetical protein
MNPDRLSTMHSSFDSTQSTPLRKRNYDEMMAPPQPSMGGRPHPTYGFPMASPEVLANRRILKISRPTLSSMQSPHIDNSSGFTFAPSMFQPLSTSQSSIQPSSNPLSLMPSNTPSPPPIDFTSFNLKDSVNETGLWQMSGPRLTSLSKQLPTFLGTKSPKSTDIRIKAITKDTENWGISADENVRTQFQSSKRSKMGDDEAETSFNQRSHQGTLIWKTDSPSLTQYGDKTDSSQPLSGHTPGIKTQNVGGTTGALTKEHGTRDPRREKILSKTFEDPNRGDFDLPIMSKLATVQLLMSPKEELETTKSQVGKSKTPIFSQFKDIGDISGGNTGNFDKLTDRVQTVRETDKMFTAKNMLISGYDSLVPDTHKQLLQQAKGDVGEAMRLLHQESSNPQSKIKFNTSTHSQTPRLDLQSLREMSQDKTLTERPMSPVRRINDSNFKF